MFVVKAILTVLEVLTCLLLVGVILLQKSKSEGLGGLAFGAGMGESLFGSRAGDVLTKITTVLAIVFLANTTLLALVQTPGTASTVVDRFIEEERRSAPAAPGAIQTKPLTPSPAAPTGAGMTVQPSESPATPPTPEMPMTFNTEAAPEQGEGGVPTDMPFALAEPGVPAPAEAAAPAAAPPGNEQAANQPEETEDTPAAGE